MFRKFLLGRARPLCRQAFGVASDLLMKSQAQLSSQTDKSHQAETTQSFKYTVPHRMFVTKFQHEEKKSGAATTECLEDVLEQQKGVELESAAKPR
jgi:hypothetical protein